MGANLERDAEGASLAVDSLRGLLPWEPGYDEGLRHFQPALWEPPQGVS